MTEPTSRTDPLANPEVQRQVARYLDLSESRHQQWLTGRDRHERQLEGRQDLAAIERELAKWEGERRRAGTARARDAAERMRRRLQLQRDRTASELDRLKTEDDAQAPEFRELAALVDSCKLFLQDIGVPEEDLRITQVGRRPIFGEPITVSTRS